MTLCFKPIQFQSYLEPLGCFALGNTQIWETLETLMETFQTTGDRYDLDSFLTDVKIHFKPSNTIQSVDDFVSVLNQYDEKNRSIVCFAAEIKNPSETTQLYMDALFTILQNQKRIQPGTYFVSMPTLVSFASENMQALYFVQINDTIFIHPVVCFCQRFCRTQDKALQSWPFTHQNELDVNIIFKDKQDPFADPLHIEKQIQKQEYFAFFASVMTSCFSKIKQKLFNAVLIGMGSYAIVGEINQCFNCVENVMVDLESPVVIRFESCGFDVSQNECHLNIVKVSSCLQAQEVHITPTLYFAAFLTYKKKRPFRHVTIWDKAAPYNYKHLLTNKVPETTLLQCVLFACFRVVQLWVWGFAHFDLSINNILFDTFEHPQHIEFVLETMFIPFFSHVSNAVLIDLEEVVSVSDRSKDFAIPYESKPQWKPDDTTLQSAVLDNGYWKLGDEIIHLSRLQSHYDLFYPDFGWKDRFPHMTPACASLLLFLNSVRNVKYVELVDNFCADLSTHLPTLSTPQELFYTLQSLAIQHNQFSIIPADQSFEISTTLRTTFNEIPIHNISQSTVW